MQKRESSTWKYLAAPVLALSPSMIAVLVFVYGFILWTVVISFSGSKMVPELSWVGLTNYAKLWRYGPWQLAVQNFLLFSVIYVVPGSPWGSSSRS